VSVAGRLRQREASVDREASGADTATLRETGVAEMGRMLAALKALEGWRTAPAGDARAVVELPAAATTSMLVLAPDATGARSADGRDAPLWPEAILALAPAADVAIAPDDLAPQLEARLAQLTALTDELLADEFPVSDLRAIGIDSPAETRARRSGPSLLAPGISQHRALAGGATTGTISPVLASSSTGWGQLESRSGGGSFGASQRGDEREAMRSQFAHAPIACELPPVDPQRATRELAARIVKEVSFRSGLATVFLNALRAEVISQASLLELAVAIGEQGDEVLVIDLDRSSAGSGVTADSQRACSFADVLAGGAPWLAGIRETNLSGVAIVEAGGPMSALADLRSRLEGAWRRLPDRFRYVLIAGGAGNQQLALQIAGTCRATYLTVEVGQDRRQGIDASLAALRGAQANVRGAIVVGG
jgi:hypothetical protein